MLSTEELAALAVDLESSKVERKATLSNKDKVYQAVCAFANDLPDHRLPGVIFVGLNDDGSCANTVIDDALLLTLAHMRSDGSILPFPTMAVERHVLGGCAVAVVQVLPSYNPPVRYQGRVWIRVGPRRAIATPDEERRLIERRRAQDLPFDQQPVTGFTVDDLDLARFQREYLPFAVAPEVLEENHRPVQQQLASLRFQTQGVPNYAAILVLGKEPLQAVPGAYVQFVRFEGTEITAPIKHQREISGPISDVIRQLEEVLTANISTASDVLAGPVEQKWPDYPLAALQQLARNAILHRSYSGTNAPTRVYWYADRIEIHSPGGLFGQVTPENFGRTGATDYRNPLLAEAMKVLGFVQRFGLGIPLAKKGLEKNGNPEPDFEFQPERVLVTIRRRP